MLSLLATLIIIGVVVYIIGLIPMDAKIMQLIRVVAIIAAVLIVLQALGVDIPLRLPTSVSVI